MRKWKIKILLNNGKKVTGYVYIEFESGYEALKNFICEGKEFNEGTLLALRTNNKKLLCFFINEDFFSYFVCEIYVNHCCIVLYVSKCSRFCP